MSGQRRLAETTEAMHRRYLAAEARRAAQPPLQRRVAKMRGRGPKAAKRAFGSLQDAPLRRDRPRPPAPSASPDAPAAAVPVPFGLRADSAAAEARRVREHFERSPRRYAVFRRTGSGFRYVPKWESQRM